MPKIKNSDRRAGKRKDRNLRFETRDPALGYYLIVTDTKETEKNYFEGLKKSMRSTFIEIEGNKIPMYELGDET